MSGVLRNERAYELWAALGSPRYAMAPMVDGSDLPFRSLCRSRGTTLCYSPMLSAKALCKYVRSKRRLEPLFCTEPGDRPLFFQVSGNDPALLAETCGYVLKYGVADGVDLNLGCPQYIAQRSLYGAFLMLDPERVRLVVEAMADTLRNSNVLVSCKIRILPNLDDTVAFCKMLEKAGCQVLGTYLLLSFFFLFNKGKKKKRTLIFFFFSLTGVHGRTKEQRGNLSGDADWEAIAACKRAVGIPVILNGNISQFEDVEVALAATGCDGVMSAWGLLRDPGLYQGPGGGREREKNEEIDLAREWLLWTAKYRLRGDHIRKTKLHIFKRLVNTLRAFPEAREHLSLTQSEDEIFRFLDLLASDSLPALAPRAPKPVVEEDDGCWVDFE